MTAPLGICAKKRDFFLRGLTPSYDLPQDIYFCFFFFWMCSVLFCLYRFCSVYFFLLLCDNFLRRNPKRKMKLAKMIVEVFVLFYSPPPHHNTLRRKKKTFFFVSELVLRRLQFTNFFSPRYHCLEYTRYNRSCTKVHCNERVFCIFTFFTPPSRDLTEGVCLKQPPALPTNCHMKSKCYGKKCLTPFQDVLNANSGVWFCI